jgi:hypothetical protein
MIFREQAAQDISAGPLLGNLLYLEDIEKESPEDRVHFACGIERCASEQLA